MSEIEEALLEIVFEQGISSKALRMIRENLSSISPEFLTDILAENVSLYSNYQLLIEFLPQIWNENKNSSENLLVYLCGLAHRFFYLAREYPLGKGISENQERELQDTHKMLCNFMETCLEEDLVSTDDSLGKIDSFEELLIAMNKSPKYPSRITDIFQVTGSLFYHFALNENQKIRGKDELGLYLSRCFVLWKLGSIDDQRMVICLEKGAAKLQDIINQEEFEKILALEIQNYQFLQLGIDHKQVKLIVDVFSKLSS